ncbi:hypothetical protein [Armatimonas sp.]|uniref:hypothetical protein n=1 Tax=Armatimonas sp. TaxID=1872638 RepID=UPI00286D50D2|nr:hypothetical protein [Armatimonas sp.]
MKFFSALMRWLFFLTLTAALAWNIWQVRQLRTEVNQLKAARGKAGGGGLSDKPTLTNSLALLKASKAHAEKAQALLKAQKLEEAAKETKLAAETAQKAYAGAQSSDPLGELQSTVQSLSKQVGSLWETEKKKEPKKP